MDMMQLAEVTATLRPGPDGVPLKVEPETVTAGQPIEPGTIATTPVPVLALRRLLDLAWDRSTFVDHDADLLGAVEKWLGEVAPKDDKEVVS